MTLRSISKVCALTLGLCSALSGCGASLPNLTTGSLFGASAAGQPAAAAPQVTNDPTSRAVQVGTTAARAQKCGFNFDSVKLRTQFLAAESATLTNPADAAKLNQVYDIAFNGISKAVASKDEDYCTDNKTRTIKEALNRHLAGDYTPSTPEPVADDGGFFGDVGSTNGERFKDSNPMNRNE
jgi:hypothetical protein